MILSVLLSLAMASPTGWLYDGTAHVQASAPLNWSDDNVVWRTPLSAPSNASPVMVDDLVCLCEEPTTIVCLDAQNGTERWRATNDYPDTLTGSERTEWEERLASLPSIKEALRDTQREISNLRRQLRRAPDDAALQKRLSEADAAYKQTSQTLEALAPYSTFTEMDLIGYSTPTPLFDGDTLYVLTGQGVLSAFTPQGDRKWATFVGPAPLRMRGWDMGATASPRMIDGVLVVPYRHLQGLDPKTGEVIWTGPVYEDFGTPAVGHIDGLPIVATPDGHVVHGATGQVLAKTVGDIWYTGPNLKDDILYYVGGFGDMNSPTNISASASRLTRQGDSLTVTPLWNTQLPISDRVYAAPLLHEGMFYIFNEKQALMMLDANSGDVTRLLNMKSYLSAYVFMQPLYVGGKILVGSHHGNITVFDPADNMAVVSVKQVTDLIGPLPVFKGKDRWVRYGTEMVMYREP